MSEWQPISTAPKDGTDILVIYPLNAKRDSWEHQIAHWWAYEHAAHWLNDDGAMLEPTHWMPLPTPPHESRGEE